MNSSFRTSTNVDFQASVTDLNAELEKARAKSGATRGGNNSADTPGRSASTSVKRTENGKKPRHRMTNRQLEHLEALYQKATHPSRQDKEALATKVGM